MKLLEAAQEIAKLNDLQEDGFDDRSAIDEVIQIRRADLALGVDRALKVVRYCRARIKELELLKEEVASAIIAAKDRKEAVREYVRYSMGGIPDEPFEGRTGRFAIRKNGGLIPISYTIQLDKKSLSNVLLETDVDFIPPQYLQRFQCWILDTEAVRRDLAAGIELGFAKEETRGSYIKDSV